MSGDTLTPETEVEIENTDPVQTDDGDAWATAKREYMADPDEGAAVEDSDPEIKTPDEEAEPAGEVSDEDKDDPGEDDDPKSEEAATEDAAWDRNPETLPDELKPVYKDMEKHFHETNRLTAAKGRKLDLDLAEVDALKADYQAKLRGSANEKSVADATPPPLPTSEDSDTVYHEKADARSRWFAKQEFEQAITEGRVSTPEQMQDVRDSHAANGMKAYVASLDGYTDDIGVRMAELSQTSRPYAVMTLSEDGLTALMAIAKTSLEGEAMKAENVILKSNAAKGAAHDIKHKAAAPSRAVSRPGGARPQKGVSLEKVKGTPAERLEAARESFLNEPDT